MRLRLVAFAMLLALAGTGCFRQRTPDPGAELPTIEVRNRYFGAIVVYLVSSGASARLGLVQSNRTERFRFPVGVNPYGSEIRLLADPVGDFESYRSEPITISGNVIVLTVENELRFSTVVIR